MSTWLLVLGAAALGAALTGLVRRYALKVGMLDRPNLRSSHSTVVPRGGGLAIVCVALLAALVLHADGAITLLELAAWLVGGGAVAAVGFVDDARGLGVASRAAAHLFAAGLLAMSSNGFPMLPTCVGAVDLGYVGWIVAVLAIVWAINLFNFMDGIDGIAAGQAVFVFAAGAWLSTVSGATERVPLMLAIASASAGFLAWNWAPARVFMGDVGSGFLGFAVAAISLCTAEQGGPSPWVWLILCGTFVADATVTLAVRVARGERVYVAHRSHVYQRLARCWRSHARVTLAYAGINVLWLLPWAWHAVRVPENGPLFAAGALLPLVLAALALGAGQPGEPRTSPAGTN